MQTSVDTMPAPGVPGMLADLHTLLNGDVISVTSEEETLLIPFGVVVKAGVADKTALLLVLAADVPLGVVVYSNIYSVPEQLELDGGAADNGGLKPGVTFSVLRRGRIWVQVEDAVAPGDAVRYRAVDAGVEQVGAFRAAADGTDTVDISQFARWVTSADAGDMALVEVDFNNAAFANPD